jgi:hypothetical protein
LLRLRAWRVPPCPGRASRRTSSGVRAAGRDSSPTCPAASSAGGAVRCRGAGGPGAGFRGGRGRRGMGVGGGARSAPSGGGRAGGGPGEPGHRALGGSRVPLALAGFLVRQARRGMRGRCCAFSTVIDAAGTVTFLGEAGMGAWGKTWNRAVFSWGRGGSGFPPSAFPDWSSLLSVHSQSRAVVFLTSPSCLVEGVRSGTRRRRGPCPSPQAGGGTGPGMRRAAPVHESAVLYGRCTVAVWPECGFVANAALAHGFNEDRR